MATNILSTNDILTYIKNFIKARNNNIDVQPGTDLYDIVVWGNAQTSRRIFRSIQDIERMQSIFTTFGDDLDLVASNYNLVRKRATYSQGYVTFYTTAVTSDIIIPDRIIITTTGTRNVSFTTIGTYVLLNNEKATYFNGITGRYEIIVPVACTTPGLVGNVAPNTISSMQPAPPQIQGCLNENSTTGGTDSETDEDLQQRCALSWVVSSIGTRDGYKKTFLDQDIVRDAIIVGPFDTESIREGVDVYVITTSALAVVSPQSITYNNDEYTTLTNQPVVEITSIIRTNSPTWNMLENVSWTFNTQPTSSTANSSIVDANAGRLEWAETWSGSASSPSASGNTLTYEVVPGNISVTSTDAYVNTKVTFTSGSINNLNQTRTVTGFSYNSAVTPNVATFTFSPAFTGAITTNDPFTLNPRPNTGDTVNISYNYNGDIQTLQDFIDQSSLNVVGSNIMVKNGLRGELTLTMNVKLFPGYDFTTAKSKINNAIGQYITTLKFGDDIQLSDLIIVAQTGQGTDYTIIEVDYVDIDTSSTASYFEHWGETTLEPFGATDIIELDSREYAVLKSNGLIINQI